jgi:Phosphotransferase enzyme family
MPDVVSEMLAACGATRRRPWAKNVDSLSGSHFEQVLVDGRPHIVKHIGASTDWLMRALGDGVSDRPAFVVTAWRRGLLDALPAALDHTIVDVAWDPVSASGALLMRDESSAFVPSGNGRVPLSQHQRFLDHMAQMHASFWGFTSSSDDLLALGPRFTPLSPSMAAREALAGHSDPVPMAVPGGWASLASCAFSAYEVSTALIEDPAPLVKALLETPTTLIHGDWKFGNLGSHPDGRTVLVDWGWPGAAGPAVDLAWYLAVNCDRLPSSKEASLEYLRARLEHHGVETAGWWERQVELALVGAFLQLGWSKTGDPVELAWWVDRIVPVARDLL